MVSNAKKHKENQNGKYSNADKARIGDSSEVTPSGLKRKLAPFDQNQLVLDKARFENFLKHANQS